MEPVLGLNAVRSMTSNRIIVFIDPDSSHSKDQHFRVPGDRENSPGDSPRQSDGFPASQRYFHPATAPQSTQSVLSKGGELEEKAEGAGAD